MKLNFVHTARGRQAYRKWGNPDGPVVIVLHGNAVNSAIWEWAVEAFPEAFSYIAPDLRGYGNADPTLRIDATRGVYDWLEDILALRTALRIEEAFILGHSLGGNVAWAMIAEDYPWLEGVVLLAPGTPFGFGGTKSAQGEFCFADAAGSGAGLIHPKFVEHIQKRQIGSGEFAFEPLGVFRNLFHIKPETEVLEKLASLCLQMQCGVDGYPGDSVDSPNWPYKAPGVRGGVNALSPLYQAPMLEKLLNQPHKNVPLIWMRGAFDPIINNASYADPGYLGSIGLIPDWPGMDVFPPQPMLDQIRYVIETLRMAGSFVTDVSLPDCGHFPFLEQKALFRSFLKQWLTRILAIRKKVVVE